jgi:hypothetical protein
MTSAGPSRRTILKRGLLGTGLLALGGGAFLASRSTKVEPPPPEPLLAVSPEHYAVLAALARRFIPDHPGYPSADSLNTALAADRIISWTDPSAQKETIQLLGLFENALAGFLFGFRTRPFTQLSPTEQDEVLAEWQTSRIAVRRTGYLALRAIVISAYYGQKPTWVVSGYPGPPAGVYQPDAPEWRGGDTPRPPGFGVWTEPAAEPTAKPTPEEKAP